jgi:hypothetical protein
VEVPLLITPVSPDGCNLIETNASFHGKLLNLSFSRLDRATVSGNRLQQVKYLISLPKGTYGEEDLPVCGCVGDLRDHIRPSAATGWSNYDRLDARHFD